MRDGRRLSQWRTRDLPADLKTGESLTSALGIADTTSDVFLEAAFFDPATVAGRGRCFGLIADASQRFERGVDPELQERAIERATQVLLDCAGRRAGPVSVTRTAEDFRFLAAQVI